MIPWLLLVVAMIPCELSSVTMHVWRGCQFSLCLVFPGETRSVCLWRIQWPSDELLAGIGEICGSADGAIGSLWLRDGNLGELARLRLLCFPGVVIPLVETVHRDYCKVKRIKAIFPTKR